MQKFLAEVALTDEHRWCTTIFTYCIPLTCTACRQGRTSSKQHFYDQLYKQIISIVIIKTAFPLPELPELYLSYT